MEKRYAPIWKRISAHIKPEVGEDPFKRWFRPVQIAQADETRLMLCVPNNIFQHWIEINYLNLLQDAIIKVLGGPREIEFCFAADSDDEPVKLPAAVKEGVRSEIEERHSQASAASPIGMNARFTFDTFVVGRNNEIAHAAARAVAEAPAKSYNPLFVHGGVGLGKTHLMQAIGQYVSTTKRNGRVIYLSSEKFTNDFIDAIQNNTLVKFRKRYRQADVLLIDDIQFLAGKERSQEEFFHTFNTLFDGHKQIVLSSDRPPAEIVNLEQRLVSRFEWGLTTELQPPDVETRVAILRKKAQALNIKLDSEMYDFLAQRVRTNVRRLEGALMRVASFSALSGRALGPEAVEHLLKDILQEEARKAVTIDQIQRRVAEHFDVRLADMTSKRRPANIAFPRQIAMYLSREMTKSSLSEIGDAFGGRDHGTVLHAHRLVKEKMRMQEQVRQCVSFLSGQLNR
jgi:chromosomal replication initiator protein